MNYTSIYELLSSRLAPCSPQETQNGKGKRGRSRQADPLDEELLTVEPVDCGSFDQLHQALFIDPQNARPGDLRLEYALEIEQAAAMMTAVILSTTTTGGQLGLRVIGPPGSAKSTLAECFACCPQLVYSRSKFTGIVSGWASIRKSENTAAKMNGKCVLIKDADTMVQQSNLRQIESELRDALGDAVIRAEYRTGREFTIFTLFSMIMCGTPALRQMDDAALGARFLDICIHKRGSSSEKVVKRAIKSQFEQICSQLSGEVSITNDEKKRKPITLALAPHVVGFLLHKRKQIDDGMNGKYGRFVNPLTAEQETRLYAMGELVAYLRQKIKRSVDREITVRPERELGTRLGEQFIRSMIYLAIVFQDPPVTIGEREFEIALKVLRDTTDCYGTEVVFHLASLPEDSGATQLELASQLEISNSLMNNILQDLRATGIITITRVSNPHHRRGQKTNIYTLTPEVRNLCQLAGI